MPASARTPFLSSYAPRFSTDKAITKNTFAKTNINYGSFFILKNTCNKMLLAWVSRTMLLRSRCGINYFFFLAFFLVGFFSLLLLIFFSAAGFGDADSFLEAPESNKLITLSSLLLKDFNC